MTLPPFLTRIQNAAGPLLGGLGESELGERLRQSSLVLEIDAEVAADPAHRAAYLLAVNLGARLYPRIGLDAPEPLMSEASELARSINAGCEFGLPRSRQLTISWRGGTPEADRVTVSARDWNLAIDGEAPAEPGANPLAAMASAAIGIGEIFRALFSDKLPHGRKSPAPFEMSLLTLDTPVDAPPLPDSVELGTIHLAGCGAIGQAFGLALHELPLSGKLIAVDHETLDEGNLQRYLLSTEADIGTAKPELLERALVGSDLIIEPVSTPWGADERTQPGRETVVSALDSKQGRIELQAGLPRELFNAWTQPEDIGVSRHQAFGEEACLACIAWPRREQPGRSESIARALGENELRVIKYLGSGLPVGEPLPPEALAPTRRLALPGDAATWTEHSLLQDVAERYKLPTESREGLKGLGISELYRDAVCAGMLIEHGADRGGEVSVPLAHQSALAGILLASWLVIDRVPALRDLRPKATQARFDLLRGGDQVWPRPRPRFERCICGDADYEDAYRARWEGAPQGSAAEPESAEDAQGAAAL
jgi:hypothetical protein